MQLEKEIQEKINSLFSKFNKNEIKFVQRNLTDGYKHHSGKSVSLIKDEKDSILYAISRMPATYSVNYTLMHQLVEQGFLKDIKKVADVGSGTGSGYFALSQILADAQIDLFEKDDNMIGVFNYLSGGKKDVTKFDITCDNFKDNSNYDLVVSSYLLSELNDVDRKIAIDKLIKLSGGYVLIIDTGTPKTYKDFMEIKDYVSKQGYYVVAPCMSKVCALENDYCQFYARVERSGLHRMAKDNATLSYEDEKYFYLLISKNQPCDDLRGERVIRRPEIKTNLTTLKLCSDTGIKLRTFSKHNKEDFKRAKKIKINDIF